MLSESCIMISMKTTQIPYPELAKIFHFKNEIFLKREDQHKYGSHKGRSIPVMIKKYFKENKLTDFVISSSGNAGLAGINSVQSHNINNPTKLKLKVFIGQNIDAEKLKTILATINDPRITLEQVDNPKQSAFLLDKSGEAKLLRQSTDDNALAGYFELAEELSKIPKLSAVFIPTSSGTTAQGLGDAFTKLKINPQIHIIQTPACHPIFDEVVKDTRYKIQTTSDLRDEITSIAGAIVDKVGFRKDKVYDIVKKSSGMGWIASDEEIKEVINLLEDQIHLKISPNSALSIVGLKKALDAGWKIDGNVVCLITGM